MRICTVPEYTQQPGKSIISHRAREDNIKTRDDDNVVYFSRTRFRKMRSHSKTNEQQQQQQHKTSIHIRRKKAKIQNRTQTATTLVRTCRSMWKGNDSKQKAASIECSWYSWRIFFSLILSRFASFVYNHISRRTTQSQRNKINAAQCVYIECYSII